MKRRITTAALYAVALAISLFFIYPFYWMIVSSFRTQAENLSSPLQLWPEQPSLVAYRALQTLGGLPLMHYVANSIAMTLAASALVVVTTTLGTYALWRKPGLPLFGLLRNGFLLTVMYPAMLLVIPLYVVRYRLGMLGSHVGIVLVLSLLPIAFFMLNEFLKSLPRELVEAAMIDGAGELQILAKVIVPVALPIVVTVSLIAFLLIWKQWFPVLVISTSPSTYTLPVALLSLNGEYGVNFEATMALATITTLPIAILFASTQRRVSHGLTAGAIKG
jgi:ABC-type glycerol-3-phosphate transport system permease component